MSRIVQVRRNGVPVQGLFRKLSTEADVFRFVGAESGHAQVIHKSDDTVLSDGRSRVTIGPSYAAPNNTPQYIEFVLDFQYFVGLNQLQIYLIEQASGVMRLLMERNTIDQARQSWTGWPSSYLDPDGESLMHAVEVSPNVARVMNPWNYVTFMFLVSHTSLQATNLNRITIENQGDNRAINLLGRNDGIVFTSPSGRRGLLRMDDNFLVGVDRV